MASTSYSLALFTGSVMGPLIAWLVVPPNYIEENDAMFMSALCMVTGMIVAGWLHRLVLSRVRNAMSYKKTTVGRVIFNRQLRH
jgi:hypothetical protein